MEACGGGLDGEAGEEAAEGVGFAAELLVFVASGHGRVGGLGAEEEGGEGIDVAAEDGGASGQWAVVSGQWAVVSG